VSLAVALADLLRELNLLRESLVNLHTTAIGDRPLEGDVVLVDVFGDAADDLIGAVEEAIEAISVAQEGHQGALAPIDIDPRRLRLTLVACQATLIQVASASPQT
jgi:hypothetical protein